MVKGAAEIVTICSALLDRTSQTAARRIVFRKVFQLCGVLVLGWNAAAAIVAIQVFAGGEMAAGTFALRLFLFVCGGCGLGLVMILFNPHKVIQNYQSMRVHRMVGHRRDGSTFADKIGVGDDED
jgi:hypothetical protein